jgi:hypothetical protein
MSARMQRYGDDPVVLKLAGGVNIAKSNSSNTFQTLFNDGLKQRRAWRVGRPRILSPCRRVTPGLQVERVTAGQGINQAVGAAPCPGQSRQCRHQTAGVTERSGVSISRFELCVRYRKSTRSA